MENSRREFGHAALGTLAAWSLLDAIPGEAMAASVKPLVRHWMADLDAMSRDLKGGALPQTAWQEKVEALFARVDLRTFLERIDFEEVARKGLQFKGKGAKSIRPKLPAVEGLPKNLAFGRQIFTVRKGRSVVPHGHDNMATAFFILRGRLHGRHYERLRDEKEHMIVRPTIDSEFGPAGISTVSDYRDNVHWFEAVGDAAFIFNIHVLGVDRGHARPTGRVYIDPAGEKIAGGKVRARIIGHREAHELYG